MSWHYSPELAAEFSEPICSDGAQSPRSKLTSTLRKFYSKGRETVCSLCFQSGTTSKPSTEQFGVEKWIASLPDSHANLSPSPESSSGSTTPETCGRKLSESFAMCDLDLDFSKTSPVSWESTDTSEPFSGAWPKSGMMSGGVAYLRPPLAPLTDESDYGLKYPTPCAHQGGYNQGGGNGRNGKIRPTLSMMARKNLWPTPRATDGSHGGRVTPRKSKEGGNLIEAVSARTTWPTPTTRDYKDGTAKSCQNVPVNGLLGRAIHKFSTPTVGDSKNARNATANRSKLPPSGLHGGETLTDQVVPQGGSLNPDWVELLMGWPRGWTALDPIHQEEVNAYFEGFSRQGMYPMRQDVQPTQNAERTFSRSEGVFGAETLQPFLWQYQKRIKTEELSMESEEAEEKSLRNLSNFEWAGGSSLRPELQKQRPIKSTNTLSELSQCLARYGSKAWKEGSWENGTPRVASGVEYRVDRLKAIGNGQVPATLRAVWELLNL